MVVVGCLKGFGKVFFVFGGLDPWIQDPTSVLRYIFWLLRAALFFVLGA